MKRSFHYADVRHSKRLQAVRDLLVARGARGATSIEIVAMCQVVNPAGAISELRAQSYEIECKELRNTVAGRKKFLFVLKSSPGHKQMDLLEA